MLVANRTFVPDLFIPELRNTGSAEVVSTWCGNWTAEHIQTDGTWKVLFRPGSLSRGHPRHRQQGLCIEQYHHFSNSMTITEREDLCSCKVLLIYSPCCGFCLSDYLLQNACYFSPERENCFHVRWLWFLCTLGFIFSTRRPLPSLLLAPPLIAGSAPTDTVH